MAMIRKLMISGIRSFGLRDSNTLEFYSPLTLIVGANGTGKTTIIECLKYATTGSLPPNSRGGAFIYDPKMAGEVEVCGQVRLLFTSVYGKQMVCSRTLQLSLRRERVEQKTVESVLREDGEGVSGRRGDIDAEMPVHLGVPSSVLENIIFCHQEESTWPLSEPVVVKKKLDEIFASSKYGKALDSLKSQRRECMSGIKLKMQELEFLRKVKERRDVLVMSIRSSSAAIERNEVKLEAYETEIVKCNRVIGEICADMMRNEEMDRRMHVLENERSELRMFVGNFGGRLLSADEASDILKGELLRNAEDEYARVEKETDGAERRFKMIVEERSVYLRRRAELDGVFSEISIRSSKLEDAKAWRDEAAGRLEGELRVKEGFRETAKSVFSRVEGEIVARKEKIQESEGRLQRLRDEEGERMCVVREKKRAIEEYEMLEDDVNVEVDVNTSYEEEIERLRMEMCEDREVEVLEERLEEYQKRLNKAYSVAECNFEMNRLRSRRREIESMLSGVEVAELQGVLCKQVEEVGRKREKIKSVEKELGYRNAMKDQARMECKRVQEEILAKIDRLRVARRKEEEEIVHGEKMYLKRWAGKYSMDDARSAIGKCGEWLMSDNKESILGDLEPECVYDDEQLAWELDRLDKEVGKGSCTSVYVEALEMVGVYHVCRMCNRKLSDAESEELKASLESMVSEMQVSTNDALGKRAMLKKAMQGIEERNMVRCEIVDLMNGYEDVPEYEAVDDFEGIELDVLDAIENMKKIERQIEAVNEMFVIDGKLKDVEEGESVQELKGMIDGIKRIYEEKRRERRRKNELMTRLCKKQALVNEMKDIREKINFREEAKEAIRMIEKSSMKAAIDDIENEIARRRRKLERIQDEYSKRRVALEMDIEMIGVKSKEIDVLDGEIGVLNAKVKELLQGDWCEEARDERMFETLRNELVDMKSKAVELGQKIRAMYESKAAAKESIKYYSAVRRIGEIECELGEIDCEYLSVIKEKKIKLEEKKIKLISHKSLILGECKQIALGIKGWKQELQNDHVDTVEKYSRCFVELKALEASCSDLEICIQVLDKAIVDFHSFKLDEVNTTLKDLWRSTYVGGDIDWIEIKTESMGQKTYNYKVVMVKNGVELDMRGRSSAGQRMIASILIRLALADSFALNCSILALDEPTTNLDRGNMESFALMLSKVISAHKHSPSFQLVVITHDEDFVELLNRDGPEYFYRLKRDEGGNSAIIRHSVYGMHGP
ncbi:AAA domain-containign protein [Ordospora pajunii]|uniref:AAA domain-containign protein n=1 Tax=Ordospora pajunii TaxID=3039483 RepID=UPI00295289D3|nr:AAA domain-containign protein [Ordospora pajunii]KAH9411158.1 AAA domain-containign protein [Ordospora pajunii]